MSRLFFLFCRCPISRHTYFIPITKSLLSHRLFPLFIPASHIVFYSKGMHGLAFIIMFHISSVWIKLLNLWSHRPFSRIPSHLRTKFLTQKMGKGGWKKYT